jgi:hypothetical protein
MSKLLTCFAIVVVFVAGCRGQSEQSVAGPRVEQSSAIVIEETQPPTPVLSGPVTLTSEDGEVQEEVVYLDSDEELAEGVQNVEIPPIIISALSDAPAGIGLAGFPQSRVDVILESHDGAVQEEVVYTETDALDTPTGQTADVQSEEIVVASLQLSIL